MEYIFEFILELIFEGSIEASQSSKIPKIIRYPLIILIVLFFIAVIGLIFLTGILLLKDNEFLGIIFIILGLLMAIMSIIRFRQTYLTKKTNQSSIK